MQDSEKCWFCGKSAPFLGRCWVVQHSLEGCRESGEARRSGFSYRKGVEAAFHKRVDDVEAFIYNEDFRGPRAGERREGRVPKDTPSSTGGAGEWTEGFPESPGLCLVVGMTGARCTGGMRVQRLQQSQSQQRQNDAGAFSQCLAGGRFHMPPPVQEGDVTPPLTSSRCLLSPAPSVSPLLWPPLPAFRHTQAVPPVTILLLPCLSLANVSISAFSLCVYVPTNALTTVHLLPSPVH